MDDYRWKNVYFDIVDFEKNVAKFVELCGTKKGIEFCLNGNERAVHKLR